jgi:hypothetical protein
MKVYLGKPRNHWYSPYTFLEKVFFWREISYQEPKIIFLNKIFEPFAKGIQWVLDKIHPEVNMIKIDYWDTWSMDYTLSPIILPMLKQLKETQHGSAMVDVDDVPFELQYTGIDEWSDQQEFKFEDQEQTISDSWGITHDRWNWVLNEIIWTFEQLQPGCDWEDQYWIVKPEADWDDMLKPFEDGQKTREMKWKVKGELDAEGMKKHNARIDNGLRLFGKIETTIKVSSLKSLNSKLRILQTIQRVESGL